MFKMGEKYEPYLREVDAIFMKINRTLSDSQLKELDVFGYTQMSKQQIDLVYDK